MFPLSYKWLYWTRPSPNTIPPPGDIPESKIVQRAYVTSASGQLEVLTASPPENSPSNSPPLFFVHGGMGSAWVWMEYMEYLAQRGITCYSVSLRGHGNSWHPSYFRLVYGTTRHMLSEDVITAVAWAQERERERERSGDLVLVGHSSGGGLCQHILTRGTVNQIRGLVLLDAVPSFGSVGVYWSWIKLDPLCFLRMIFHLGHPNSILSTPELTKQAFFSDAMPLLDVTNFQRHGSRYESLLWPSSMLRPFANEPAVVKEIGGGWGVVQRIMIMSGSEDKLMPVDIMKQLAAAYRDAVSALVNSREIEWSGDDRIVPLKGEGDQDDVGRGVRFCLVPGAGHHAQNDVTWEVGAQKLFEFCEQL